MAVVRGTFNEILRPGLREIWDEVYGYKVSKQMLEDDLYGITEGITGVKEVELGRPPRRKLESIPHAEDEWPPKDWP